MRGRVKCPQFIKDGEGALALRYIDGERSAWVTGDTAVLSFSIYIRLENGRMEAVDLSR